MFDNLRSTLSGWLYPEMRSELSRASGGWASALNHVEGLKRDLRLAEQTAERQSAALRDLSAILDGSKARLQTCEIKAANWDHLVRCHESAAVHTFVVFAPAVDGTLEPISSEPEALTTAIYEDRLKHGAKQAG